MCDGVLTMCACTYELKKWCIKVPMRHSLLHNPLEVYGKLFILTQFYEVALHGCLPFFLFPGGCHTLTHKKRCCISLIV